MKKYVLLGVFFALSFYTYLNQAYTYDVGSCMPCSSCNAAAFGKDASCTSITCSLISCVNPLYNQCEGTYLAPGTSCGSGNTCCRGICQADPRTDLQCQDKTCSALGGWTASNKPDGTTCTYNTLPSTCLNGACQTVTPDCILCSDGTSKGSCSTASPGKRCVNVAGTCQLQSDATCPTCSDGKQNQGELGVDCGGPCPTPCTAKCSDGTPVGSCCSAGKKCQASTLTCVSDGSCPSCVDTDGGDNPSVRGTCTDLSGGLCSGGGCTDTCASNSIVTEYYCSGSTCASKQSTCTGGTYCSGGYCGTGGGGGGCGWWASNFGVCSSGCPPSYPDQQFTCCDTIGYSECGGKTGCASYNPLIGETPCCTASGYSTCTPQQTCTPTGCQSVCTGADKTSQLYCDKCNHCQDGIQNCGEPIVDRCGASCTVPQTSTYTTPGSYGGYTCANPGQNKCQYYNPGGWYNIQCLNLVSCSYYEYGCVWNCQGTRDIFNTASCSDDVQNCAETGVDCGAQCNAGARETDNSYQPIFSFTEPSGLTNTKMYTDPLSWNCADGIDNDKDCLKDCADPDCSAAIVCSDSIPPTVIVSGGTSGWQNTDATAVLLCSDPITGCNAATYRLKIFTTNPGLCPANYNAYDTLSPAAITSHVWVCGAAKDNNGNAGNTTYPVEFQIEKTPPSVTVTNVPDPLLSKGTEKFTVTCSDADSGCNLTTIYASPYSCTVNHTRGETSCQIGMTKTCEYNPYTYTASTNDAAGNVNNSAKGAFTVKKNEQCSCLASLECFSECNGGTCGKIYPVVISAELKSVIISLGKTTRVMIKIENPNQISKDVVLALGSQDEIKGWTWFTGHKTDESRRSLNITVGPNENRTVTIDAFGAKVGTYKLFVGPDEDYSKKYFETKITVVYRNAGLLSTTPDMGLAAFILLILASAVIAANRKTF